MDCFSEDYFSARDKFRGAARETGAEQDSIALAARGPGGEALSIDFAWRGAPAARRVLIHCSGLHGVEGFAGSAIQVQVLRQLPVIAGDCALLLIHCLNPFGMSWLRRANEQNVDLNRNFIFAARRPEASATYARLDPLLNPPFPPRWDGFYLQLIYNLLRYGYGPLKAAIACGQYSYPRGLFFGGQQLEEGPGNYRNWLLQRLPNPQRLLVLDVHTGLGAAGQESLLHSLAATPADELGERLGAVVSADGQENKVLGYRTIGSHEKLYANLYPGCRIDFITHEFGTRPSLQVLSALRAENQWHHFGSGDLNHSAKQRLRQVFCPAESDWQRRIVARGQALVHKGLDLLAAEGCLPPGACHDSQ